MTATLHTKRLPVSIDFATTTWDQQNRLLQYEVYRELGLDQAPWTPPVQITLRARCEALDATWNALKSVQCGQRMTIDWTVSFEWAGDYEVMERRLFPMAADASGGAGMGNATLARSVSQDAGQIELVLRTYNPNVFFDVSNTPTFATVPGVQWWWE
jgi:hypothetical protein